MKPRTILCIDVDGVVNALGDPPPDDHRVLVQVRNAIETFPVRFDPRVVDGMNALTRASLVQLTWVTTWGLDARDALAPAIGLDAGSQVLEDRNDPATARHPYDPALRWWKLHLVLGALRDDPGRPVAWIDDDIDPATARGFPALHPGPSLLITPDPGDGVSLRELDAVAAFARRQATG